MIIVDSTQTNIAHNNQLDYSYTPEFQYQHNNPYHNRLSQFNSFVLRDNDGEKFLGHWNADFFKKNAPLVVEIGTGYGHFMMKYTQDHPHINYVGLDYRFKRSYQLACKLSGLEHQNFCYLRAKGERIHYLFSENEVDTLLYYFPDPWPKTRHNKKRLFQTPFLKACLQVLKPGGRIYIKTDHDEYFQWMKKHFSKFQESTMTSNKQLTLLCQSEDLYTDFSDHQFPELTQYQTKFEKIFLSKNIKIKSMVLECKLMN